MAREASNKFTWTWEGVGLFETKPGPCAGPRRCETQETGVNSHAYRLSECTPSRTAPGSSGTLPSRPPVEWGSELAGNPIHSRPRHPKNRSQIKIYRRSSRLPTPTPPDHTPGTFGKVPSQTRGAPGASEPELYKIIDVRGPPPPPSSAGRLGKPFPMSKIMQS